MLTLYIADVERDAGMKKLSREEAAKVLEGMKVKTEIPKAAVTQWERNAALDMAIEVLNCSEIWMINTYNHSRLNLLPPIQPKRGKWNRLGRDAFNCNKCGATFVLNQGGEKMRFCPNCGADMRGEQDE